MTSLEGPVAGWVLTKLGPLGRWVARQVLRDHQPISGRKTSPSRDYDAFYLFVAVAPSDAPRPQPQIDFVDAAHRFVGDGLPSMFTTKAEYSGTELVRWRQPIDNDPLAAKNSIVLYPNGLIELQWRLEHLPDTALQLGEIISVVGRLHELVRSDAYPRLYRKRWLEQWRRVDWRIGVNGRAVPRNGGNMVEWTELITSAALPKDRIDSPHPNCPHDGYGACKLTTIRRDTRLSDLLAPVMEGLLSAAGYTNAAEIRKCVVEISSEGHLPDQGMTGYLQPPLLD